MKLINLIRMSNARLYELEIYGAGGERISMEIDVERENDKMELARYSKADVVRFQPIITDDDAPALEVELNA